MCTHGSKRWLLTLLAAVLLLPGLSLRAQVTIGDDEPPMAFSILEIVSNNKGGLRLPQLSTADRNTLSATNEFMAEDHRGDAASSTAPGLALGLTIYNTDTNCTEYWNGYKWISLCLGTADIVLRSPCGDYDPQNPPEETPDGIPSDCVYTPEENPACTVSSGQAFEVLLMAGGYYATLTVDPLTSAFSVSFTANNSSLPRNAVVRVTSNCTGEFKDFVFSQDGATCTGLDNPSMNSSTFTMCSGGSVFAHVTNAASGVDYIWTYAGSIIHTGSWMEIKRAGVYQVYTELLGCGTPATVTVTDSNSPAPAAIRISATNGGILCSGGNVILTANTTDLVQWYHDGIPLNDGHDHDNPLTLIGGAMAGDWFAAVEVNGGCVSNSSNVLSLIDNTGASLALPVPVAEVNGQSLTSALTICKGGTLKLEITNAAAYPAGTQYEWFNNGVSIGRGTVPIMYLVAPNTTSMVLSVTASDQSGSCPNTAVSLPTAVTLTSPGATSINYGANQAAICGGTPATLTADHTGAAEYEWMKDGYTIVGQTSQTMNTTAVGKYTVRYKDASDCWSRVSTSIDVIQSAALSMSWNPVPTNVVKGDQVTYVINSAPLAGQYQWSYSTSDPNAVVSIHPIGNGTSCVIQYGSKATIPAGTQPTVDITVESVGHPCGDVTLTQTITVEDGCTPGTSVNLTPNGTINCKEGDDIPFSATSNATDNNNDLKFEWFVDGTSQGAASPTSTFSYNTTNDPGTHTVSVRVTNDCTDTADNITAQATVNVNPNPGQFTHDDSGNFRLTGKDCFDIARSNFGTACGTQAQRPGDFLDASKNWDPTKAQYTYTFVPAASAPAYSNLQFVTDDPSVLIQSQASNIAGRTLTITFDPSVLTKAYGKDKANALTITVYALYEQPAGTKKRVELKISVQDCWCGCGAYIAPGVWKVFMCHNLGADETLDPFTPAAGLHGDKYRFGAKSASYSMPNDQSNAATISGWTLNSTTAFPLQASGDWNMTISNPCDPGYRVPTYKEWQGVINISLNPQSVPSGASWTAAPTNYSSGHNFGSGLFLPAAGSRYSSNGQLNYRGHYGYYWASTQSGTYGYHMFLTSGGARVSTSRRADGFSVRCVAE